MRSCSSAFMPSPTTDTSTSKHGTRICRSPAGPPSPVKNPLIALSTLLSKLTKEGRAKWQIAQKFVQQGSGYSEVQSTKPQTLAYALTDSPVGLLAWIYEKLVSWSDKYPWTDDEGEDTEAFRVRSCRDADR